MAEEKKGFFKRLVSGLAKTRDNSVAFPVLTRISMRNWRKS